MQNGDTCTTMQVLDKHGISPLLAAIYEDHVECVKFLLEKVAPYAIPLSSFHPLEQQHTKTTIATNENTHRVPREQALLQMARVTRIALKTSSSRISLYEHLPILLV